MSGRCARLTARITSSLRPSAKSALPEATFCSGNPPGPPFMMFTSSPASL